MCNYVITQKSYLELSSIKADTKTFVSMINTLAGFWRDQLPTPVSMIARTARFFYIVMHFYCLPHRLLQNLRIANSLHFNGLKQNKSHF